MPLGNSENGPGGPQASASHENESAPSEHASRNGCLDRILLVGAALFVCVIGGAAFWLAEDYHVNPVWVFFAGNSIAIAALFIGDFRTHLKKPSFVVFLAAWALIHGLFVVTLMRWMSILAMIPLMVIELTLGYFFADLMFGIRPKRGGES